MEADSIRDFIGRLISSTQSGKLTWQETADEDAFRLLLDAGIILVQRIKMQKIDGTPGEAEYKLLFFNQNNTLMDHWYPDPGNDTKQLSELFESARNSALKPSKFFQSVQKEVIQRSG